MTIIGSTEISLHAYETRVRPCLFPELVAEDAARTECFPEHPPCADRSDQDTDCTIHGTSRRTDKASPADGAEADGARMPPK